MPVTTWAATRVGPELGELPGENDENRSAQRNQRVGPQSRQTLAPLPLEADDAAEQDGHDEIERVLLEGRINDQHEEPSAASG